MDDKKLTGTEIAKVWRDMQRGRLKRMKVVYKMFKKELKKTNVWESELDVEAKKLIKEFKPDLEELRWNAIVNTIVEGKTK